MSRGIKKTLQAFSIDCFSATFTTLQLPDWNEGNRESLSSILFTRNANIQIWVSATSARILFFFREKSGETFDVLLLRSFPDIRYAIQSSCLKIFFFLFGSPTHRLTFFVTFFSDFLLILPIRLFFWFKGVNWDTWMYDDDDVTAFSLRSPRSKHWPT